jgi:hypothetical protein
MARSIVPVTQMARRLPQAGRIRIGVKAKGQNGKEAPRSIDTFRFTSADRTALDQVAAIYGGIVKPWADPLAAPGQFEVITEASEIRVALPPDPLGGSPNYELWGKGGRARNCDGETCEMLVAAQDGIDQQICPCICWANNVRECSLITRLSVLLPEIRFIGVWRLDSKSDAAAHELPGMVELVQSLQARGIVRAILRIESRRQAVAGKTRQYKVPVLGLDDSVEALAAGMASLGSLGASSSAPVAELGSGEVAADPPQQASSPDDEVIDAELVEMTLSGMLPEGVTDNQALVAARNAAKALQVDPPTSIDQVTDERLIGATLDLLAVR